MTSRHQPIFLALLLAGIGLTGMLLAQPPAMPKLSTIVPADDLSGQLQTYLKELDAACAGEANYKSSLDKIKRVANVMAAVAFSLARHDTTSDLTARADGIAAAARHLKQAKEYPSAKAALAALHAAFDKALPAPGGDKIASLGLLMEEAEIVNARLRNSMRRFDPRRLEDNARAAAAMAAIAQASVFDTHEVKDPKQLPDWYRLAGEMRDAAGQLNAAYHGKDKAAATAAITRLENSCKACHKIFAPME